MLEPLRIHCGVVLHPARHPESHHSTQDLEPWRPPVYGSLALVRRGTVESEDHTTVDPNVQAPFESFEDVHLDRRVIRWSQVVHGERAHCELHHNGPVVPIGNHRQDAVCALRWPRRCPSPGCRPPADKGAHQLPASREETFQVSFEAAMRTPGPVRGSTRRGRREHQRRFQVVVGEVNSPGGGHVPVQGVLLLVALLPRRRPDDEESNCFLWMGQPDSLGRTL